VDQLINLVGELVITQAMLAQSASLLDASALEQLQNGLNQLERNTRDIQEAIMSVRMLPISFVFSRFPRVVRDVASKLNKQVELKNQGEATELDKALIEKSPTRSPILFATAWTTASKCQKNALPQASRRTAPSASMPSIRAAAS